MQILIRTLKRKKFLTRRYHWSKKRFLRNLSRVSLRKTWYTTNHDRSINEASPGQDRTKSKRILMILAETTDLAALTTISDGLVKPIEWAIEQLDLARLRARIVANIGSKLLLLPATHPLLAYPGQNLCASNPGGWPIALHAAKAIVTMLKVVFTFRYVTPDTGDNGKSTNSEQSGTRPPSTLLS